MALLISALLTYNIPLSIELQHYTQTICAEYNVDPILAFAVMEQESRFTSDIVSQGGDYGLMQVNRTNHEWLSEVLGITDFLDPEQNILAGVYMLSVLEHPSVHHTLMAYNMGLGSANRNFVDYIWANKYSNQVVQRMIDIGGNVDEID